MTPEQKIKWAILAKTAQWSNDPMPEVDASNIDGLYETLVEDGNHWDGMNDIRCGDVETVLGCEQSRHLESKSVAAKMPDGTWVGWTYWYGGGKHSQPESVDWMDEAYNLDCEEKKEMVTVRVFSKVEA